MDSDSIQRGETIGRFLVIDHLGQGGMGVVVSAYDAQLDRRVAVKLLRPERAVKGKAKEARERLLREAKAMAQLRHPNAVTVYEVGTHGDQVFLAMELAESGSLRDWLGEDHDNAEITQMFVAAGRGLAAAHQAGMIHRDFKPENVLVGSDERVQVTDFGLVGAAGDTNPASLSDAPPGIASDLTKTGAVLGTPLYMSPEQHLGEPLDARSDQYSFCVALWEALYGDHPFGGGDLEAFRAGVLEGRWRKPPRNAKVPRWVHNILVRGIARDPDERFETMDALLEELDRDASDSEIGRRTRNTATIFLGTLWTALPLYGALTQRDIPTLSQGVVINLGLLFVALIIGVWARDSLSASTFNRQIRALIVFIFVSQFATLFGMWISDLPRGLGFQMMLHGWFVIAGTIVIVLERRLWPAALTYLAGFLLFSRWPEHLWWAMAMGNFALTLNAGWIWRPRKGILGGRFPRRSRRHRGLIARSSASRQPSTMSPNAPTPIPELAATLPASTGDDHAAEDR